MVSSKRVEELKARFTFEQMTHGMRSRCTMWTIAVVLGAPWVLSLTLAALLAFVHAARSISQRVHILRESGHAPLELPPWGLHPQPARVS